MLAQNEMNMQKGLENKTDDRAVSDKHRKRKILAKNQ